MRARWSGRSTDAPERASGSSSRSASDTLCLIRGGPALRSGAAALRAYFGADFIPERNMSCIFSLRDRAARLAWASGRAARRRSAPLPECNRRRVCGYEGLDQPGDDDVASFELCPCCETEFGFDDDKGACGEDLAPDVPGDHAYGNPDYRMGSAFCNSQESPS